MKSSPNLITELVRLSDNGIRTITLEQLRRISTPANASVLAEAYRDARREGRIKLFQQDRLVFRP